MLLVTKSAFIFFVCWLIEHRVGDKAFTECKTDSSSRRSINYAISWRWLRRWCSAGQWYTSAWAVGHPG